GEWIEDKYSELLCSLTRRLLGDNFKLEIEARAGGYNTKQLDVFSVAGLEELSEPPPPEPPPAPAPTGAVIGELNPQLTLDRFVVGPSNEFAFALCQAVGDAPGRHYNPMFIHGGVGLGKTHLLHAIGNYVLLKYPSLRIAYVPSEQFTNELIRAIRNRRTAQFQARYRTLDVLLVDDAHFLAGKHSTQEEFFHTFNTLHDARKQVVLVSDRAPQQIAGLEERLISRFAWGVVSEIARPCLETRMAILQRKAEEQELEIGEDVLVFIAERCRSSVRELEGALIKLLAFASLTEQAITSDLARSLVGSSLGPHRDLSAVEIDEAVAHTFGLTAADLRSKSRRRPLADARAVAMYLERTLLGSSYTQIGRRFGGRDHSTVIHSIQKVERQLDEDGELRRRVDGLRARLR
ncbi:MAG: chromosomal replication initiator protein DnaA, partial [Gemmatimonadales bacterium]|nr:chromosomal replication initiator protein DnaA [Gemmatimonadales bacterium]